VGLGAVLVEAKSFMTIAFYLTGCPSGPFPNIGFQIITEVTQLKIYEVVEASAANLRHKWIAQIATNARRHLFAKPNSHHRPSSCPKSRCPIQRGMLTCRRSGVTCCASSCGRPGRHAPRITFHALSFSAFLRRARQRIPQDIAVQARYSAQGAASRFFQMRLLQVADLQWVATGSVLGLIASNSGLSLHGCRRGAPLGQTHPT
jgi:hypothetical protein